MRIVVSAVERTEIFGYWLQDGNAGKGRKGLGS